MSTSSDTSKSSKMNAVAISWETQWGSATYLHENGQHCLAYAQIKAAVTSLGYGRVSLEEAIMFHNCIKNIIKSHREAIQHPPESRGSAPYTFQAFISEASGLLGEILDSPILDDEVVCLFMTTRAELAQATAVIADSEHAIVELRMRQAQEMFTRSFHRAVINLAAIHPSRLIAARAFANFTFYLSGEEMRAINIAEEALLGARQSTALQLQPPHISSIAASILQELSTDSDQWKDNKDIGNWLVGLDPNPESDTSDSEPDTEEYRDNDTSSSGRTFASNFEIDN